MKKIIVTRIEDDSRGRKVFKDTQDKICFLDAHSPLCDISVGEHTEAEVVGNHYRYLFIKLLPVVPKDVRILDILTNPIDEDMIANKIVNILSILNEDNYERVMRKVKNASSTLYKLKMFKEGKYYTVSIFGVNDVVKKENGVVYKVEMLTNKTLFKLTSKELVNCVIVGELINLN